MSFSSLDPLVLRLVEWVAAEPRPYAEAIEAWRTSCPRLTVWEEAFDRGFLERIALVGQEPLVRATSAGVTFLRAEGRAAAASGQ